MRASKLDVVRLGARDKIFHELGIGDKARLLNVALKARLPVPGGIVLLDSAWQRMIEHGIIELAADDTIVHSADEFLARCALNAVRRPLAVRAAFAPLADGNATPMPIPPRLNIAPDDRIGLINALVDIWRAGAAQSQSVRRDILVMEIVAATQAGIAESRQTQASDFVSTQAMPTDRQPLARLHRWQRSTVETDWQRRLQYLLRGTRHSLSLEAARNWRVTWADDGRVCWLLQMEPLCD